MKNNQLQRAVILSLIQHSLLLSDDVKKTLVRKLPRLTLDQLEELQRLIGKEESILLHPRELGLEEVLKAADADGLKQLNGLLESSIHALGEVEQQTSEATDAQNAQHILDQLS